MSLFATNESSIGALKTAVGTAAYFVLRSKATGKVSEVNNLWFCRAGQPDNGTIDPIFLLSAYFMNMGSKAKNVYIVPTYHLSNQWLIAFDGIAHLAQEQQLTLNIEKKSDVAPGGEFAQVTEVKLGAAPVDPAITNSPDKVIDDLFVPLSLQITGKIGGHGTHTIPRLYMMAAVVMEKQFGASVLALITNRNGAIVAFDCKMPEEGGCGHAETKALFSLKGQLPDGGAVFSTLKPCTMCAGLLNALDPKGKLRKYWVRDDPSYGANWHKGLGLNSLPNAQPLDQKCENAKYLKVPSATQDDRSFLETFDALRGRKEGTKGEQEQWFQDWLASLKLPKDVFFVAEGNLMRGQSPEAKTAIKNAKQGITNLNGIFVKLGRFSQSPKELKGRKYLGLTNEDQNTIKSDHTNYIKKRTEAAYPARIIDFIPGNPASVKLRTATQAALVAKLKKYGQWSLDETENRFDKPLNPNVEKVLLYLRPFLAAAGVKV